MNTKPTDKEFHPQLLTADSVLVAFALDDCASLEVAKQWLALLKSKLKKHVPRLLVGTKGDLWSHHDHESVASTPTAEGPSDALGNAMQQRGRSIRTQAETT